MLSKVGKIICNLPKLLLTMSFYLTSFNFDTFKSVNLKKEILIEFPDELGSFDFKKCPNFIRTIGRHLDSLLKWLVRLGSIKYLGR